MLSNVAVDLVVRITHLYAFQGNLMHVLHHLKPNYTASQKTSKIIFVIGLTKPNFHQI